MWILQDFSAREWVKQGAPKEKLMIGMPTYGRSFTLVDKAKFDIGAPASGGGLSGNFTNEPGFLSYYEVSLVTVIVLKISNGAYFYRSLRYISWAEFDKSPSFIEFFKKILFRFKE